MFWTWTITRAEDMSSLNFLSVVHQPDFFNNSTNFQLYTLPPSILTSLRVFRIFSNYLQLKCLLLKYPCWSSPSCITRCMQISFLLSAPVQQVAFHNFTKIILKNPQKLRTKARTWDFRFTFHYNSLRGCKYLSSNSSYQLLSPAVRRREDLLSNVLKD